MTNKKSILKDKSFAFALLAIKTYKHLTTNKKEFIIAKQLLLSGLRLVQILEKHKMRRVKLTLFTSWQFLKRSVMKQSIGWNCFTNQNTLQKMNFLNYTIMQTNF